ncbi:MAG: hypothetical protein PHO77_03435 [Bacteroidales bacterium]|jgi:SprT protein|nr:hypothetical protein [Bacteroidales bacterium]
MPAVKQTKEDIKHILSSYIPEKALDAIADIIIAHRVSVEITRTRKRVHGTYQRPTLQQTHRITINHELNPYLFLITLLHEFAHMYAWVYKKSLQHNDIWKKYFAELLLQFIDKEVFPEDVKTALMKHIPRISSSDFLDIVLTRTLLAYNKPCEKDQDLVFLTDLPQDTHFVYNRSLFIKQQKLRKYYLCKEVKTNRMFKYHPLAKVKPMVD